MPSQPFARQWHVHLIRVDGDHFRAEARTPVGVDHNTVLASATYDRAQKALSEVGTQIDMQEATP